MTDHKCGIDVSVDFEMTFQSLPTFLTVLRLYWIPPMSLSSQTPFISLPFLNALFYSYLLFLLFQRSPSEEAKFEPDFYWGHTVFKSSRYNTLYLGCDENKMATLVPMKITNYPNPQAMFIVNEFNVVLHPGCNWQSKYICIKSSPYDHDDQNLSVSDFGLGLNIM